MLDATVNIYIMSIGGTAEGKNVSFIEIVSFTEVFSTFSLNTMVNKYRDPVNMDPSKVTIVLIQGKIKFSHKTQHTVA